MELVAVSPDVRPRRDGARFSFGTDVAWVLAGVVAFRRTAPSREAEGRARGKVARPRAALSREDASEASLSVSAEGAVIGSTFRHVARSERSEWSATSSGREPERAGKPDEHREA